MDVARFLEQKIAPRIVFDGLEDRRAQVRFMAPRSTTPAPTTNHRLDHGGDEAWTKVTFGDFADRIRKLALYLSAHGLGSGDRAAIYGNNRVEWMIAALAIQAAGGAMVPIYPSSTAEQAAYVIAHSDAKVVFVEAAPLLGRLMERWSELGAPRLVLLDQAIDPAHVHQELSRKGRALTSFAEIAPHLVAFDRALSLGEERDRQDSQSFFRVMNRVSLDQTAVMLYTSGTTGNPKGVPLSHRNIAVNGADWLTCNAPLLREGAVDLLWLPMSHIFGFGEACLGNTLGFVSYLVDPKNVIAMLPVVSPQVFMSVPSVWEKLATAAAGAPDVARDPLSIRARLRAITGGRLEFCLSGGAGLKRAVKELFHDAGLLIIEGYGLTETSPTLTLNRPDDFRFDSVGKPLPSVELKLADDGEILARGASVFSGYHKDAAATAEAFNQEGWLKTGDIGRFTDDGFLQIIDRKKDILVTAGGKNVPPVNIEQRFADDPWIAHLVVYGEGKRYLVAGVWLNDAAVEAHLDAQSQDVLRGDARAQARRSLVQDRIDRVNAELPSYETIKTFVVLEPPLTVEGGLLTPTLKVRRRKVYEAFGAELEALYPN